MVKRKRDRVALLCFCIALGVTARSALAFPPQDKTKGECGSCHKLTKEQAGEILKGLVQGVLNVEVSPVPGFWVVDVETQGGQRGPVYVDFSKRYVMNGNLVDLVTRENLSQQRQIELNRVDFSKIPLSDSIVIGNPSAENKIAVFTDPDCPHCRKLHPELEKAVGKRKDLAFYVKVYSVLKTSYEKAKAIACTKSRSMLDDAMAGKAIAVPPGCEPKQLEANQALARDMGIRSTPTFVFPDGRVIPSVQSSEQILELLEERNQRQTAGAGKPVPVQQAGKQGKGLE